PCHRVALLSPAHAIPGERRSYRQSSNMALYLTRRLPVTSSPTASGACACLQLQREAGGAREGAMVAEIGGGAALSGPRVPLLSLSATSLVLSPFLLLFHACPACSLNSRGVRPYWHAPWRTPGGSRSRELRWPVSRHYHDRG